MRARWFFSLAAVAGVVSLGTAPVRAQKVCVSQIAAEMVDKVESSNARSGAPFRFRVTVPGALDDGTAVPSGTIGYGLIRAASSAGRHNHDGMISLEPRYLEIRRRGGNPLRVPVTMNPVLPVAWTPSEPLLSKAATGAASVPIPVAGLVMSGVNSLRWGRNITLGPGFVFSVLPVENLSHGPIC
ncbi:MAG: hypothetical protein JWO66_2685 [Candidatus Eremiobacteraeota bacterium]|nr:hypothetical protein [Candidatus Eremiobacteraeota bacterium]